jgi:peptidoglycan/xylan/chitin deacetylase (PgdA/CDA1 family)
VNVPMAIALGATAVAVVVLHLELNLLAPARRGGLRVLMYHRIGDYPARDSVAVADLDRQVGWLKARGHSFVGFSDLLAHRAHGTPLPDRPVLLTFDDGTRDHFEHLLPVLQRHQVPAGLFVVSSFVGREMEYAGRLTPFLDASMLGALSRAGVQIGLHSATHRNFTTLAPSEVEREIAESFAFFAEHGIPVEPVLAYPFGAYPRKQASQREAFFATLRRSGVQLAFRIGNRVNPLPLATDFEITRIGVRRADRMWSFAIKVKKGRRKALA